MTINLSSFKSMAIALVVVSATVSSAQSPYSLRVGFVSPTASSTRDSVGKSGATVGISRLLESTGNLQSSFDLDFIRIGGTDFIQGISAGYSGRIFLGQPEASSAPFFGFTAGVSFNRIHATTALGGSGGSGGGGGMGACNTESLLQPFGEFFAGLKINNKASIEAFYRVSNSIAAVGTSAVGVRVTYKF